MWKTQEMGRAIQRKPLINLLILPFPISQMFLTLPTTLITPITPTCQMFLMRLILLITQIIPTFPKRLITQTILILLTRPTRLMILNLPQ